MGCKPEAEGDRGVTSPFPMDDRTSYKMVCSKRRGRPGAESLLWVTVAREVSGGETEASRPSCGLDQHCNGGSYRGDPGPGSYVKLGIDTGPEEPRRKRHFLSRSEHDPAHRIPAPVKGWPQIWIWANLPDFHNLYRMLLRGEGQIVPSL